MKTPSFFGKPTDEDRAFVEMVFGSLEENKENTASTIKGISASGGVCEGKVKVISGMHEASNFKKEIFWSAGIRHQSGRPFSRMQKQSLPIQAACCPILRSLPGNIGFRQC